MEDTRRPRTAVAADPAGSRSRHRPISPADGPRSCVPGGEPDPAAVRFVGQLARNAVREGTRRSPVTGRPYPAFEAEVGGRRYTLLTRPGRDGAAATLAAIVPERGRFSGEFSDGVGHRKAQNRVYDWLSRQGLQDVSGS